MARLSFNQIIYISEFINLSGINATLDDFKYIADMMPEEYFNCMSSSEVLKYLKPMAEQHREFVVIDNYFGD